MGGYYEEILKEIRKYMSEENHQEAYALLQNELAIPYIPKEYEDQIISLFNECRSTLNLNRVERTYEEDDVEELLLGTFEQQCIAVDLLKNSNIRKHLDVIQAYLSTNPHYLIRSLLIESLMEQDIKEEITIDYEGLEVVCIPMYLDYPLESEGAKLAIDTLVAWFENDNPSFLKLCLDSLVKELYLKLPFTLDEDEALIFAQAIVEYVFHASDAREDYLAFTSEKELAQSSVYELLLYKHDI